MYISLPIQLITTEALALGIEPPVVVLEPAVPGTEWILDTFSTNEDLSVHTSDSGHVYYDGSGTHTPLSEGLYYINDGYLYAYNNYVYNEIILSTPPNINTNYYIELKGKFINTLNPGDLLLEGEPSYSIEIGAGTLTGEGNWIFGGAFVAIRFGYPGLPAPTYYYYYCHHNTVTVDEAANIGALTYTPGDEFTLTITVTNNGNTITTSFDGTVIDSQTFTDMPVFNDFSVCLTPNTDPNSVSISSWKTLEVD